jgi:hypothetical protein
MKQNEWKIVASLAATFLLGGCGWFDGGGLPPHMKEARPGADRAAPVVKALPPPVRNHPHEAGVVPADEGRGGAAIGATLQGKGGQKAQRDEAEKQANELSRKAREERSQREAPDGKATPPAEQAPAPEQPAAPKD